jgi:hypothetical protein
MTLHVLYENPTWLPSLEAALRRRRVPYALHFIDGGTLDLSESPQAGVFLNRMSPSSHTRGHQGGVRFLSEYLGHLEAHGCCVLNGAQAFALEMSKVVGLPFITKHNQGGKGLGVRLFHDFGAFDSYVSGSDFEESPDGITLLQRYIEPADPFITRVELVGGVFQYAIRSSTEDGFELCPTVECQPGDTQCPAVDTGKFSLREDLTASDPLVRRYAALMRAFHVDIAGIEFVEDREGVRYTYDINCTTNYNQDVETRHGLDGMGAIARMAGQKLVDAVCAAA